MEVEDIITTKFYEICETPEYRGVTPIDESVPDEIIVIYDNIKASIL